MPGCLGKCRRSSRKPANVLPQNPPNTEGFILIWTCPHAESNLTLPPLLLCLASSSSSPSSSLSFSPRGVWQKWIWQTPDRSWCQKRQNLGALSQRNQPQRTSLDPQGRSKFSYALCNMPVKLQTVQDPFCIKAQPAGEKWIIRFRFEEKLRLVGLFPVAFCLQLHGAFPTT